MRVSKTSTVRIVSGRYSLDALLGSGGMSDVYDAFDQKHCERVALKLLRSRDPSVARRLAQEARLLERLDHPGLVRLLDAGVADGQPYLVMELVEGANLTGALEHGPLGAEATAVLGARLAEALAYAHAAGVVHRDVKPSNVLTPPGGAVRLADFGIARLVDESTLTLAGTTLGTVAYMAPEQLEDHQVGPPADIWSLGIVLLECLTGRRVYEGSPSEVVARRLAGPVPVPAGLPAPWRLLISGMLDHRPQQRLDAGEVAALLASPPFKAPLRLDPDPGAGGSTAEVPSDLTALMPGPDPTAVLEDAAAVGAADELEDAAAVGAVDGLGGAGPGGPPVRPLLARGPLWAGNKGLVVLGAALVTGLCILLALALGSGPAAGHGALRSGHLGRHGPATTRPAASSSTTTSTSTTTTTTTTTLPTAQGALSAFRRSLEAGVANGAVDAGSAQAISAAAEQAVADEAAGRPSAAANDLQQAAGAIAGGVRNGSITTSKGRALQRALSRLASLLGLSGAASPPPTSPPPTSQAPPPKSHHGHDGHGGGDGSGDGQGNGG